jgi:hypothetical protein
MKFIFLIFFSLNSLFSFSQHDFGVKVNGGASKITSKFNSNITTQKFYFVPSGQAGFFYTLSIKKSLLGAEILFSQIEGKERLSIPIFDNNGKNVGEDIDMIYRHISYLSLPIYYGFKFKKLSFNLGIQTSLALASSGEERGQFGGTVISNNFTKLNIDNYDFGARAGMFINLSKRFSIDLNYYYGINNILSNNINIPNWSWKVQQATIGLCYKLFSKEKVLKK